MERGLIALDIDGTLTTQLLSMPPRVASFLEKIDHEQWQVIFLTGRTFQFAYEVLQVLKFPYYIGVQNGALTLKMPERSIIQKNYIYGSVLSEMDVICQKHGTDYVIYSGFDNNDKVYYRTTHFTPEQIRYMLTRSKAFKENWIEVESYRDLPIDEYASLKCFGNRELAEALAHEIEEKLHLHAPLIKDPFHPQRFIAQATHPEVTKGAAVRDIHERLLIDGPIIVAGDDLNDLTLFDEGTIKIAMGNSPKPLLDKATFVAPPAAQEGIIAGLTKAIKMAEEGAK